MTNPWLITVLGMGTVFVALIIMAYVLKLSPLLLGDKSRISKPEAEKPEPIRPAFAPLQTVAIPQAANAELIAVITAAIVAARGPGASAFRISSVEPSGTAAGFNTPAWGYIDRLVR